MRREGLYGTDLAVLALPDKVGLTPASAHLIVLLCGEGVCTS